MKRPDALLLDLDGTLVDFIGADQEALALLAARHGVDDVESFQSRAVQEIRAFHERWAMGESTADEVWDQRLVRTLEAFGAQWCPETTERYLSDLVSATRTPVGVPAALARWRSSCRIAVVTNAYDTWLPRRRLAAAGLAGLVDCVVTAAEVGQYKPEPGLLLVAAARLQVEPARCLVVGDSDAHDGEAARRAGMRYLQVGLMDVVERVDAELSGATSMLLPPATPLEFADATAMLPEI